MRGVNVTGEKEVGRNIPPNYAPSIYPIRRVYTEKLLINKKIDSVNFTVNSLREFVTYGTYIYAMVE